MLQLFLDAQLLFDEEGADVVVYAQAIDLKASLHGKTTWELHRHLCFVHATLSPFCSRVFVDIGRSILLVSEENLFLFRNARSLKEHLKRLGIKSSTWFPKLGSGTLAGFSAHLKAGSAAFFIKNYNATFEQATTSTDNLLAKCSVLPAMALAKDSRSFAAVGRQASVRSPLGFVTIAS